MTERFTVATRMSAFLFLFAVAGCGDGRPTRYPVSGQVLVNGVGADNAMVIFQPATPTPGVPSPTAVADADGNFKVTTFDPGDGAPAGVYKVAVQWRSKPKNQIEGPGPDKLEGRYADANTSKIAEVTVGKQATTLEPFKLD